MHRFTALLLLTFSTHVFSQDFDDLMTKKIMDCSDISYNSGLYFIKYLSEDKNDSAKSILNYWENKCGFREPIFRARILFALKMGSFSDELFSEGALNHIFNYQNRREMIIFSNYYSYDNYKSYYGYIPPGQQFDKYTYELALKLKANYDPGSIEYLFAEFYSDNSDTIFSKIQSNSYNSTFLASEYNKAIQEYVKLPEYHMSWITGIWIPTGELKQLGVHPELGFQIGMKHKKMNYDLVMAFKFINSPNYYYATRTKSSDSTELTNDFFGGHIGLDIGRDIYSKNGHELQIAGGIAFDGFDVFKEDKDENIESESVASYNFNVGIEYRYYIRNSLYLGLRTKYNIVDYTLNNVLDFTGNPVTIHFIIGGVNNVMRNTNLKALKYKLRK